MIIEKTRYVDLGILFNSPGHSRRVGVVDVLYDKGYFGIGVSMCAPQDKFNKEEGKEIARERAESRLINNPLLLKDIEKMVLTWDKKYAAEITQCDYFTHHDNLREVDGFDIRCACEKTVELAWRDMLYTLALSKSKADISKDLIGDGVPF
jgi:hypothetical protein